MIYTGINNGNPGDIAANISNLAQTPPAGMGPPMRTILLRRGNIFSSGICVQFDDVGGLCRGEYRVETVAKPVDRYVEISMTLDLYRICADGDGI